MSVSVKATFAAPVVPSVPAPTAVTPPLPAPSPALAVGEAKVNNADTVLNFRRYARGDFQYQLEAAILTQMQNYPERFDASLMGSISSRTRYALDFSKHMLDKLSTKSVLVLNETTVDAMERCRFYGMTGGRNSTEKHSVNSLYRFLFEGGVPKHGTASEVAVAKTKFKGC